MALKTLRLARPRKDLSNDWLKREAEAVARLDHPCIVTLFDVGRCASGPYLVMELLRGKTLAQHLAEGAVPRADAVRVALEMAKGLAHAHQRGVLHRDLKPANVFLCEDGRVKLLDFGLAHLLGQEGLPGAGTPAYMAPEQARGEAIDARADVYAAAMTLREMLTGRRDGTADGALPRGLARPIALALSPSPAERPRDGTAWLEELVRAERVTERPRRVRRVAALVLLGLVAGAVVAGVVVERRSAAAISRLTGGPDRRITVAVADFANDTRDPDLDGLSGLLITSLEQSRKLRVVTRGRMIDLLRQAGLGDASRVDESLARDVGRKAGARVLLVASIRRLGDTYSAELRAIDPESDEYLFTLREQTSAKGDLMSLVDRLSDQVRGRLLESSAEVRTSEVALAAAVTPSLEAYRHYFRGKDLAARMDFDAAATEFEKALAIEPRFALAQYELALGATLMAVQGKELIREAVRNAARAPEKEAGLIRILDAFTARRFREAGQEVRRLAARFPDDADVAYLGENVLSWNGDFEGAHQLIERLVRLRPDFLMARLDQVYLEVILGRPSQARALAIAEMRERPSPGSRILGGVALAASGDVAGSVADFQASGAAGPIGTWFGAQSLAALGRRREALAAIGSPRHPVVDVSLAVALGYSGELAEGTVRMESAASGPQVDGEQFRRLMVYYLAAAGDLTGARRHVAAQDMVPCWDLLLHFQMGDVDRLVAMRDEVEPGTVVGRLLGALIAWRTGRRTDALAALRSMDETVEWFVPYYRGMLAAELGLDEEAADALGRFEPVVLFFGDAAFHPWFQARARVTLARSLDRLGQRKEARAMLEEQLGLWKEADPDLPLLAEAMALRSRLVAAR